MEDMLSPEEIENTSFPDGHLGYDRLHVDAFVRTMAAEVRSLQRDLEAALERGEAPYRAAGKEIGDLIQRAKERAHELVNDAEDSAARIVASARKDAEDRTAHAAAMEDEARRAHERMVAAARTEAQHMIDRAREIKSRVEAESSIALQEAERESRRLKQEATREADAARVAAEQQYAEISTRLERRIRALQQAEAELSRRVAALKAEHDGAASESTSDDGLDSDAAEPRVQ
ncbi:MAG TPA: DivIVA domain-containing protein [Actinomycetota bacterium]|nr:DivIVA domain-containing protein [Actinomycetota bacterium]